MAERALKHPKIEVLWNSTLERVEGVAEHPVKIEGLRAGDWVVLDFSLVVIHLFRPGLREKYSLEKLWRKGSVIDLEIKTG